VTELARALAPDATALIVAVTIDLLIGDPAYAAHPVRLIGRSLQWLEDRLRAAGFDGYGGGIMLFILLAGLWLPIFAALIALMLTISITLAWAVHVACVYSLLALGDLLHHVWRIESAVRCDDLNGACQKVSELVGRDTDRMDGPACRRAAVESLSENLTDGFVSPVFWYVLGGVPGLVLFKVVSTMDSMVGYKTPRHLQFGWCGARLDDAMNYVPARLTWLLIVGIASVWPGLSARKAWRVGLDQHAILLGPNSGWSEAATAGAVQRRIVGPIWLKGVMVTDVWIGDGGDPVLDTGSDVRRAMVLATATGVICAALAAFVIAADPW
jgi:adenosylcobinamide-phosphate synthase